MTTTTEQINNEIETMLSTLGIQYKITKIGDACPPFCTDQDKPGIGTFPRKTHIHGQNYRLLLTLPQLGSKEFGGYRKSHYIAVDYWNSYHDAEIAALPRGEFGDGKDRQGKPIPFGRTPHKVTVADILGCAQLDNPGLFEDWASEFGYDTDSRKAEKIHQLYVTQYQQFRSMFSEADLTKIQELTREL